MNQANDRSLTQEELQRRLKAVDPGATLVPSRVLRRVIQHQHEFVGFTLHVPHRKCYALPGDAALKILERDELKLGPHEAPPETVLLLSELEPDAYGQLMSSKILAMYWRLLFHAKAHALLNEKIARKELGSEIIRDRIRLIGRPEFEEATMVAKNEDLLLPPRDDRTAYVEFVALYQEMRCFNPELLPIYFPGVDDHDVMEKLIDREFDGWALFESTRPEGAPDPSALPDMMVEEEHDKPESEAGRVAKISAAWAKRRDERRLRKASRTAESGNVVRNILTRCRVSLRQDPKAALPTDDLDSLADRLAVALEMDEEESQNWREALLPLLRPASGYFVPNEARLLYDLQKICVDNERPLMQIRLFRWLCSFGRQPLRTPLPRQSMVLTIKHLRTAARRLRSAAIAESDRARLLPLIYDQLHRVEHRLHEGLRPDLRQALEASGIVPDNLPERAALAKMVEELAERIVERGFIVFGDLRDSVSRNNLKLPDLENSFLETASLMFRDRLLKADAALGQALPGVYRESEVYLRALHRFSLFAYGNMIGRFLTRFLFIPLGISYLVIAGLDHTLLQWFAALTKTHQVHLENVYVVVGFALFLFGLIHFPQFRQICSRVSRVLLESLRFLVVTVPTLILANPWLRAFLRNPIVAKTWRFVLKPLALTALFWPSLPKSQDPKLLLGVSGGLFFVLSVFLNSRVGRETQEILMDLFARAWTYIRGGLIPALVRFFIDLFTQALEQLERLLYVVDQWLRFRMGQGRLTLAFKALFGAIWAMIRYLIRVVINLFVEPQFNPIKHFPVVTVSHKLITVPGIIYLSPVFERWGYEQSEAVSLAGLICALIPGIFGFLVWELKENWKLYEGNRSKNLHKAIIGHHGETMIRLLKPGFHSGTLPKLFAKFRSAARKARKTGQSGSMIKHREALRHAKQSIRHFVESEFLKLLEECNALAFPHMHIHELKVSGNRIRVELIVDGVDATDVVELDFRDHEGWLVAGVTQIGWLRQLNPNQLMAFAMALGGLYKIAGVDLTDEDIQNKFGPGSLMHTVRDGELLVWASDRRRQTETHLRESPLRFRAQEIAWSDWTRFWDSAATGETVVIPDFIGRVLPKTICDRLEKEKNATHDLG